MNNANSTILIVGAAGRFGGFIVPELAKRGVIVRRLIRDEKQGEFGRQHGAAEILGGYLRVRGSLDAALKGVEPIFYIASAFQPDEQASQ